MVAKKVYDSIDWTNEPNFVERTISDPNKERIKCQWRYAVIPQQCKVRHFIYLVVPAPSTR